MANFSTHLAVGTLTSSLLATIATSASLIPPEELIPVTMAGIIGSILPDVDFKDSRVSQTLFTTLGFLISFVVIITFGKLVSICELWILWLSTLVLVRFGGQKVFYSFSKHRGIWHSILSAILISILGALFFSHALRSTDIVAWSGALFLGLGYLFHLILDEIYSVNYLEAQTKRSIGTALKFYDPQNLRSSIYVIGSIISLWSLAPPYAPFLDLFLSPATWNLIGQNLFPKEKWFAVFNI